MKGTERPLTDAQIRAIAKRYPELRKRTFKATREHILSRQAESSRRVETTPLKAPKRAAAQAVSKRNDEGTQSMGRSRFTS